MHLDQIEQSLPNGFHDARLHSLAIDGLARTARLVLDMWIGRPEAMELYRPALLNFDGLHFWVAEPRDCSQALTDGPVRIDMGNLDRATFPPMVTLPTPPQGISVHWLYVDDWNATIYFAAERAAFRWTGEEFQRD